MLGQDPLPSHLDSQSCYRGAPTQARQGRWRRRRGNPRGDVAQLSAVGSVVSRSETRLVLETHLAPGRPGAGVALAHRVPLPWKKANFATSRPILMLANPGASKRNQFPLALTCPWRSRARQLRT